MSKIIKKIKHPEDPTLGKKRSMGEFAAACEQRWRDESFEEKKLISKKHR